MGDRRKLALKIIGLQMAVGERVRQLQPEFRRQHQVPGGGFAQLGARGLRDLLERF
jgi:hypothetical protein